MKLVSLLVKEAVTQDSSSVGLDLALDESGWMMSVVLVLNHVSPTAQTMELEYTTVVILRMWQSIVELNQVCLLRNINLSLTFTNTRC